MTPPLNLTVEAWRALAAAAALHAAAPGMDAHELGRAAFRVSVRGAPGGMAAHDADLCEALASLSKGFAYAGLERRLRLACALQALAHEAASMLEPAPEPPPQRAMAAVGFEPESHDLFPAAPVRVRADIDGPFIDGDR